MQQKFLSNLVLLILLNLVVKPIAIFGIDATVQNRVGSEEYGLYFSLLNFTYLFNILLDLGINNFTTKNVAQHPGLMAKYVGRIAGLRIILLGVYVVFTIGIALALGYSPNVYPILGILIIQQFFIAMIAYSRSYLSGMMLFRLDAVLSILDRFLLIILCGSALIFTRKDGTFQIEHFIIIQFICYLVSFFVGFLLVKKHIGSFKVRFHRPISLLIIRESSPYALLIVLMILYTRVDSVMLERMLSDGATQAGFYAQGFRLIDAFFMFAMLFSNLLLPIFSRMLRINEDVKELFSNATKLLIWGAIALAGLCFWNSHEILQLIYTSDVSHSAPPFQLLVLTFVAMCLALISGTYLTALGEMKALNTIALIGLIVNIGINLYLIPKYGVMGVAISTLGTQFTVAIAQMLIVVNQLKLNWGITTIALFILYVTVIFGGVWLFKEYELHLILQLIFILVSMLVFKVINVKLFSGIISRSKGEQLID